MSPRALLLPVSMLLVAYWPGLSGPLMLDDAGSLTPIVDWLEGRSSAMEVLLGNISGPTGRPLAMASFLLNAAVGGDSVWALKFGNLLLHGLAGLVVWRVSHQLLRAADITPAYWPLLIAGMWLLHPLQLSTVLYTVQRMTQLAALFSLLAILAWFKARDLYRRNELPAARLWLGVAMPLFTVFAVLGKENGVLAPILCVVLDLALFGWSGERHREQRFVMLLIIASSAVALGALVLGGYGDSLLAGYGIRDYSPVERVMTQMRVLWHYVGQVVWPDVPSLGLYHDAFVPSRGWLEPRTTVLGLLGWACVVGGALVLRRQSPMLAAGVALFLVGHSIEASPLNLELYFEHRNYLPMLGLVLAAIVPLQALVKWRSSASSAVLLIAICLVFAAGAKTFGKSLTWASQGLISIEALRAHPESIRAHVDFAIYSVEQGKGEAAEDILTQLASRSRPEAKKVGLLFRLGTSCYLRGAGASEDLSRLGDLADGHVSIFQSSAFEMLADKIVSAPCKGISANQVAVLALAHVAALPQPESLDVSWRLRRTAGKLMLDSGNADSAAVALAPIWEAKIADGESVLLYLHALDQSGKREEALRIGQSALDGMRHMERSWREQIALALRRMRG